MKKLLLLVLLSLVVSVFVKGQVKAYGPSDSVVSRYSAPEGRSILKFNMRDLGDKEKYRLYVEIFKSPQNLLTMAIRRGDLQVSQNVCYCATLHKQETDALKIKFDIIQGGILFTLYHNVGLKEKEEKYPVLFSQMGL